MTVYKYTGRTKTGAVQKGTIQAASKNAALTKLREQGINPRQVEESKSILHKDLNIGGSVKTQDFVMYCRQFATLVRAGVTIVDATNILSRQSTSKPLKKALELVEDDIRSGMPFSTAVAKHPKVFPELFVSMMLTGEATGNFDETLERLAAAFEKSYRIKKKVQSTLAYPTVLTVLMIVVVIYLLLFIVPTFTQSFKEMGAELPTITVWTIAFSDMLKSYWYMFLLAVFAVVGGFMFLLKTNKQFHFTVNYILLRLPGFGPLLQKNAIARLMRNLSSLFSSAVPIIQAITISEKVSGNPIISKVMIEVRQNLERGGNLSDPLEKSWLFPPIVSSMTKIGETTGSLDYMLEKVADYYEEEVDRAVDTLKSLIEPLMIVVLAGVVGVIVAAILMPMFSLYEQM